MAISAAKEGTIGTEVSTVVVLNDLEGNAIACNLALSVLSSSKRGSEHKLRLTTDEGKLVGYCLFSLEKDVCTIDMLENSTRGSKKVVNLLGVGTALLDQAIRISQSLSPSTLSVQLVAADSHKFYLKRGFEVVPSGVKHPAIAFLKQIQARVLTMSDQSDSEKKSLESFVNANLKSYGLELSYSYDEIVSGEFEMLEVELSANKIFADAVYGKRCMPEGMEDPLMRLSPIGWEMFQKRVSEIKESM
ncbi:MAG: GNAT family N-acetyltransferase [Rhabdochlamydiaceae bacterium]|nr:GNAT family N-acetyltransferase [Candidatus Amphrikana amoebophyrae]